MSSADQQFEQAVQAHRTGDVGRAEELYRQVIGTDPGHAPAYCNLGIVLVQQGRTDEGVTAYQQALRINPKYAEAHFNLGNAYRRLGRMAEAVGCFRTALRLMPHQPAFALNLGVAYAGLGRWVEAADAYGQAVRLDATAPGPILRLADALHKLGRFEDAVAQARQYTRMAPDDPQGHHLLALSLASCGHLEEAVQAARKAVQLNPNYAEAHNSLGVFLESAGRPEEAFNLYRRAVQLNPRFPEALNNLGTAASEQGLHDESIRCRQAALELQPQAYHFYSNLLLALLYPQGVTPADRAAAHDDWGRRYAAPLAPPLPPSPRDPDPERRLRIGYLSSDFRDHPVGSFLEAVLGAHSHERFHLSCFANVSRPDTVTERLKARADAWHVIIRLRDPEVADLVRREAIDILVDLNGHTAGNRLLVLARKPALIQVELFGYPDTTGLRTMDYRVTDALADPPGETETLFTEKLWRLPEIAWVYQPPAAPDVGPLPADRNGYITFGSLNNLAKLTPEMIALWAELLKRVERSRLTVLVGRAGATAERVREQFARHGILGERLDLLQRLPKDQYMAQYNAIDLCLDPYPYNGGVTSGDALWMGCPLVTLAGNTYHSRQGLDLLTHLGLQELIARQPEEYIGIAARWAGSPERLREERAGLRERVRRSPAADAPRYVRHLEDAYREMWRQAVASESSHDRPAARIG